MERLITCLLLVLLVLLSASHAALAASRAYTSMLAVNGKVLALCRLVLNTSQPVMLHGVCRAAGGSAVNYTAVILLGSCTRAVSSSSDGLWRVEALNNCSHKPSWIILNLSSLMGVRAVINVSLPANTVGGSGVEVYKGAVQTAKGLVVLYTLTYRYKERLPARVNATIVVGTSTSELLASPERSNGSMEAYMQAAAALAIGLIAGYLLTRLQGMIPGYMLYVSLLSWILFELLAILSLVKSLHIP